MKTVILTQRHRAAPHIYISVFLKNSQDSKPSTSKARSLFLPAPGCSRSAELGVSLTHRRPRPWAQAASAGPARAGPPAHRGHWRARRFLGTHCGGRKASAGSKGTARGEMDGHRLFVPHDRMQGGGKSSALGFSEGKLLYPPVLTPRSTTKLREGKKWRENHTGVSHLPQAQSPSVRRVGSFPWERPHWPYRSHSRRTEGRNRPTPAIKYRRALPRDPRGSGRRCLLARTARVTSRGVGRGRAGEQRWAEGPGAAAEPRHGRVSGFGPAAQLSFLRPLPWVRLRLLRGHARPFLPGPSSGCPEMFNTGKQKCLWCEVAAV